MKKLLSRIYAALIFIFLYAPIVVLIVFSFNDSATKSRTVWSGFTFKWYVQMFEDRMLLDALKNTLIIALVAAIFATVLGTAAAIGISNMKKWRKRLVMNVTNFPMVNPEIVTGVSLMLLFVFVANAFDWELGMLSIILRQMDANLYEAAQDLGCPPAKAFVKVVLPEIMPGIITGMIMAFTLSIDDFIISYFTSGTTQTLPIFIYSMTRKRISPEINALSTLLFAIILLLLLVVNIRQSREKKLERKLQREGEA